MCSSPAYAPIKRILDVLAFIPPKDEAEDFDTAGDTSAAQQRVSVMFKLRDVAIKINFVLMAQNNPA